MNIIEAFLMEKRNTIENKNQDPDLKNNEKEEDPEINDDELFKDIDNQTEDIGNNDTNDETDDTDTNDDNTDDNNADTDDTTDTDNTDDNLDTDTEDDTTDTDTTDDGLDAENNEVNEDEIEKNKKLLEAYKKLYHDVESIILKFNSSNIYCTEIESETIMNSVELLSNIKNILYDIITDKFNKKDYNENLYYYYSIVKNVKFTNKIIEKIIELRHKE